MQYEIKELNVGGVLDQAVTLTRNHFKLLFLITLVLMTPLGMAAGVLGSFAVPTFDPKNPPPPGTEMQQVMLPVAVGVGVILMINLLLVYPLTNAALIHAISNVYLGKPTTVGDSFRQAFTCLLPLVGTSFLAYLAIVGGFMLCFIPGLIASFMFFLTTQVVVIDHIYGFKALGRSRKLMKGNIGTAFVLGLLIFIIQIGLSLLSRLIPQQQVAAVASAIVQSAIFVFVSAAWVVFYFSCRCKVENFDLAILADAVGQDEGLAPPPSQAF